MFAGPTETISHRERFNKQASLRLPCLPHLVQTTVWYGDSPLPGIGPLATLGSWGKVRVFFLSLLGLDCFQIKILLSVIHSVSQFSYSVVSNSLLPHGLQHSRPPCASPTPGVYSNSCPSSHPTISSPVVPFSSRLQSFPASGSFQMSQLFASGGQSIGASASASVLPMNTQD